MAKGEQNEATFDTRSKPSGAPSAVAFGEIREGLCARFVHDEQGWRFDAWDRGESYSRQVPLPPDPSPAIREARFTTFDEAVSFMRYRYGGDGARASHT